MPEGLVALMGISQAGFLGRKAQAMGSSELNAPTDEPDAEDDAAEPATRNQGDPNPSADT